MEGYSDFFRNVCLNFKGISKAPNFQAFKPGNIRGLNADHDYLKETHEEVFLREHKLMTITDSEISSIELCTSGQSQNQRWFEERVKRVHDQESRCSCKLFCSPKRVSTGVPFILLHSLISNFIP